MTARPTSRTSLLATRQGGIEYLLTGSGSPATVFAHGLAGSIDTTRPFGGGVPGTKAFFHFRGHGASASPETDWTYTALAGELDAVARHVGATRALGVSMGAGAICRLLEDDPDRFERIVLVIPAVLDSPRKDAAMQRMRHLAQLAEERDVDAVQEALLRDQPSGVRTRPDVVAWCQRQAQVVVATDVRRALRTIPRATSMSDRTALQRVSAPILVIAQEADPGHPVSVAHEIGAQAPHARVEILPPGGVLWEHRDRVRRLIGEFLDPADTGVDKD
ncbi:alpha/beta fold hydrolase [Demetria terragena]|uniref:alpha/beta fold hydrolase n=1 Tax=Demetria terragena TaxID=63959 RepID=UPI0012E9BBE9|nr:alpha/beta hydrolase [Demetria terragena]